MLRRSFIALWVIVVLTLITVTVSGAGQGNPYARIPGARQQISKPKFEDMKLQTGMGQSVTGPRGGGFFQDRDQGG